MATAADRLASSGTHHEPLPDMSTWSLVCEEIVDTRYDQAYYERVVAELVRRGISRVELDEMRVFAWETAGWLNYEKMLWDWCSLDEEDIRRAIDWQFRNGEITEVERLQQVAYVEQYAAKAEPRPCSGHAKEARR